MIPRRRGGVPRRDARGDGPAGDLPARARALPDRRAGPHQRPGPRAPQALPGYRRRARRRHRRVLDRQRAAPGEPERPGRRADRRARPRDVPRPGARLGGRGRADRPDARGADRSACARARSTRRTASPPRSTASSRSRTSRRCGKSRCARSPRTSRPSGSCAGALGTREERAVRRAPAAGRRAAAGPRHARARLSAVVRRAWRSAQRLAADLDFLSCATRRRIRRPPSASSSRRCGGWPRVLGATAVRRGGRRRCRGRRAASPGRARHHLHPDGPAATAPRRPPARARCRAPDGGLPDVDVRIVADRR